MLGEVLQHAPTRRSGTRRLDIRHAAIRPPATQISCHRHLMAPSHAAIASYCRRDCVPAATVCHPDSVPPLLNATVCHPDSVPPL